MKQNKGLRKWAVNLLQHYSPEQLDKDTATELVEGKTNIPKLKFWTDSTDWYENMIGSGKGEAFFSLIYSSIGKSEDATLEASSNRFGVVRVNDWQKKTSQAFATNVDSPIGAVFSSDDRYMVVYNQTPFSICPLGLQLPNEKIAILAVYSSGIVKPSSGISSIRFASNDVIAVTDPNGKETKFDLKGNEIQ